MSEPLKLNVGSGSGRISGYISIDTEEECKPDLVHDILQAPLPYEEGSVEEILFFHVIEHVRKCYHETILREFRRVLKVDGSLYVSYPDFWTTAKFWKENHKGNRRFFEAALFGRQLFPTDYHVCAMDAEELTDLLLTCGFYKIVTTKEVYQDHNKITHALKNPKPPLAYEEVMRLDSLGTKVQVL